MRLNAPIVSAALVVHVLGSEALSLGTDGFFWREFSNITL